MFFYYFLNTSPNNSIDSKKKSKRVHKIYQYRNLNIENARLKVFGSLILKNNPTLNGTITMLPRYPEKKRF